MRAVEELVRRKLEKRAPDELSPKPDPYELRAPQGCSPQQRKRRAINQGKLCCHKIQQAWTSTATDRQTRFLKYNRNNYAILPNAAIANYQIALSIN